MEDWLWSIFELRYVFQCRSISVNAPEYLAACHWSSTSDVSSKTGCCRQFPSGQSPHPSSAFDSSRFWRFNTIYYIFHLLCNIKLNRSLRIAFMSTVDRCLLYTLRDVSVVGDKKYLPGPWEESPALLRAWHPLVPSMLSVIMRWKWYDIGLVWAWYEMPRRYGPPSNSEGLTYGRYSV
jgi:hypothetical protein